MAEKDLPAEFPLSDDDEDPIVVSVNMGVDLMNVIQVKVPEVNDADGAVPSAVVRFLVPETATEARRDPPTQSAWHRSTSRLKTTAMSLVNIEFKRSNWSELAQ
ncbi:unnamed protein product, partial [Cladocopium goreaui]